ncbi:LppC family lipoprotein [Pseudoxanthomonas mexicana]|nr:LppC family lipoprotein [Pseudoxanthomonas mexicana]
MPLDPPVARTLSARLRPAQRLVALLLVALLASCATTPSAGPATSAVRFAPAFANAATLARQDAALSGQARTDNAREIDRLLATLDDATLARDAAALPSGDPLYNFAGRALQRRGLPLPRPFDRGAQWRFDAGNRPPADSDGYRPPVKLAVLLPLSGNLATAAAPVRDGLLAGYYGERRRRPEIQFYDPTGTAAGATAAYARATAEGADFVVGPLGRDEVSALFQQPELATPMLVLNRGTVAPPDGKAGFSLAPEDDGIAAAEYVLARERKTALIIEGSDDNGRRASQAFRERFAERGGRVTRVISVPEAPGDLSAVLATASQEGADAVFLAVRGSTARALTPQLALAGLGGKTRVGTSQLTSGTGKPEEDMALDGIAFPTEAWTSRGVPALPAASVTGERVPTARGPAARLFAFGYDAWLLPAYLEKLATGINTDLQGATGRLQLDGFGNVVRTPSWSTFAGGRPAPIADGG